MKKEIKYITIDGRGEHESFRDCITKAIQDLKPNEGIHIIKDFEPFPMYKMMEEKGFDKYVEQISDEEFHVYFTLKAKFEKIEMGGKPKLDLPLGHPIRTYLDEVKAIRKVLSQIRKMLQNKFIKNQWAELYDKLSEINIHFARKQNQLFPALEKAGFDKPSKIMWTLDNDIKDIIKKVKGYLETNQDNEFLKLQDEVIDMIEDMMVKEEEILYPTSVDLLSDMDFIEMRKGDDEIGYCLIPSPAPYGNEDKRNTDSSSNNELIMDLANLLEKYGMLTTTSGQGMLNVSQGKLTLEQINLIFKHLQVDISFVDENEIVKFYSDTKHRVFPRSVGVIGRKVQNCHPRESVDTVEEIIRAFREGEQDKAEFWLEIGGKFIYIIYNAVRDESGNFRGVLEMMQDVTHIRRLEGNQRLLSWSSQEQDTINEEKNYEENKNEYGITKGTIIEDLVKEYPYVKEFLFNLSPKFSKLKNPIIFKTMASVATMEMISKRGGFQVQDLINKVVEEINIKEQ